MSKLRILCLHGFGQTSQGFYKSTGGLRKVLGSVAELVYISAPHSLSSESRTQFNMTKDIEAYGWWDSNELDGVYTYEGWKDSVAHVQCEIERLSPIDGVIGFSQGAALVAILAHMEHIHLQFAICIGGFVPRAHDLAPLFHENEPHPLPTCHVWGERDAVVPLEKSQKLSQMFAQSYLISHEKGHLVPTAGDASRKIREFVQTFQTT